MSKIFVAGHNGMVGSAIHRLLSADPTNEVVTVNRDELDLRCQRSVRQFFEAHKFDRVYLAAAKVGGIQANNVYPADFIYENLIIQSNVIHSAYLSSVSKLLFLGSSCIYPKLSEQPISEASLLTGPLEQTNEPYAVAKIAGIKMCESYNRQFGTDYRSIMPTNLYGPGDNFHLEQSHVLPALLRRFHEAVEENKENVEVWGTGTVRREFLHVDDLAAASIHVANLEKSKLDAITKPMQSHINVGVGSDISIKELSELVAQTVGYSGAITFDNIRPDGTPKKLLDSHKINELGWRHKIPLREGISQTYSWFLENISNIRG